MLVMVAVVFANNYLNARMAENEFSAMRQYMQTVGLQVDDVAWTIGRTQTLRYASMSGQVNFEPLVLNYTVYINNGTGYVLFANFSTGVLLFNMPVSRYSLGNNYIESIFPSNRSFLQTGTSAPVAHVYAVEKLPMIDGEYLRIVVAPTMRMLNSTISNAGETKNYFKFYFPILTQGDNPRRSQSVTLTAKNVAIRTESNVTSIRINATFPWPTLGFDQSFFNFENTQQTVNVPSGSILELYTSEVNVALGLQF